MTEHEKEIAVAIEHLKARNMSAKHIELAIQALEKQSMINEILDEMWTLNEISKDYCAIGTVEEFKALKEKSVAKKPLHHKQRTKNDFGCFVTDGFWVCPTCRKVHLEYYVCEYCDCGQHIDWE